MSRILEIEFDTKPDTILEVIGNESEIIDLTSTIVQIVELEVNQGPPGPPGGVAQMVTGEIATGLINGSNADFTSEFPFDPDSLEVFNVVRLAEVDDYNITGANSIHLLVSPLVNEKIIFNYLKS